MNKQVCYVVIILFNISTMPVEFGDAEFPQKRVDFLLSRSTARSRSNW